MNLILVVYNSRKLQCNFNIVRLISKIVWVSWLFLGEWVTNFTILQIKINLFDCMKQNSGGGTHLGSSWCSWYWVCFSGRCWVCLSDSSKWLLHTSIASAGLSSQVTRQHFSPGRCCFLFRLEKITDDTGTCLRKGQERGWKSWNCSWEAFHSHPRNFWYWIKSKAK